MFELFAPHTSTTFGKSDRIIDSFLDAFFSIQVVSAAHSLLVRLFDTLRPVRPAVQATVFFHRFGGSSELSTRSAAPLCS